ncbi:MAG: hypothetical protein VXZ38_02270 [Planctomycetota bacterium]|nr:hypothetical protein [Planctomycetota bacterium]
MLRRNFLCLAITLGLPLLSQQSGFAQNSVKLTPQQTGPKTQENANSKPPVDSAASSREQKLAEYLSGAIFSGQFTIDGQSAPKPKAEEYTISKCEKLDEPDLYRLTARIKYGQVDSEVPMNIKILWSGNTPVITLDSLWIPGMGTFGARVLIHSNRYAGTWQHDAVGGHMFGMIRTRADNTKESTKTE